MLSVTHIVFEVATIMNFVMVIMYWSMVHHVVIDKFKGLEYFHMYAIHIFPAISVLVNFYLTDIWLVPGHWQGLAPIAVLYSAVNYYSVVI